MAPSPHPGSLGLDNSVSIVVGDETGTVQLMVQVCDDYPIDIALREMAIRLGRVANQATQRADKGTPLVPPLIRARGSFYAVCI